MISALSGLQKGEKDDTCVSFALAFRSAWSLNNYHRIFKLYKKAPKMTGYVIDMFLKRERITALKIMINGYVYLNLTLLLNVLLYIVFSLNGTIFSANISFLYFQSI